MPTGYTADISKGISFEEFVMSCARNFGALVSMKEEPRNAKIPEKLEPSNYHREQLLKSEAELCKLKSLSLTEIKERSHQEYVNEQNRKEEYRKKERELEKKYRKILEKVNAWTPPTPDHNNLKQFMIEQLESSIKFDCPAPDEEDTPTHELSPEEWIDREREKIVWSINYHMKEYKEERKRTDERNKWIMDLRESLKENEEEQ